MQYESICVSVQAPICSAWREGGFLCSNGSSRKVSQVECGLTGLHGPKGGPYPAHKKKVGTPKRHRPAAHVWDLLLIRLSFYPSIFLSVYLFVLDQQHTLGQQLFVVLVADDLFPYCANVATIRRQSGKERGTVLMLNLG